MSGNLARTHLQKGELCKSRLKGAYELGLELRVDLGALELVRNIRANVGVEQQRVCDTVGIHTVAAKVNVHIEVDALVAYAERNRVVRTKLVVHQFLGIEIVNSLILAGVTAERKTLADLLEGIQNSLAQAAVEDTRLAGGIINELTGLGADLNDLALLHDNHTLAVRNGNLRSVRNDIVRALGVGAAAAYHFLALLHQNIERHCLTIEEFLPLIRQHAAGRTNECTDKSHTLFLLYFN